MMPSLRIGPSTLVEAVGRVDNRPRSGQKRTPEKEGETVGGGGLCLWGAQRDGRSPVTTYWGVAERHIRDTSDNCAQRKRLADPVASSVVLISVHDHQGGAPCT